MTTAWIGVGANLDNPCMVVGKAVEEVLSAPGIRVLARSSDYVTAPVGYADQADFCNAVIRVDTSLKPVELLDTLQAIEDSLGRVRQGPRFGPRMIDLDLLLFGCLQGRQGERLVLPHPRMHERRFVLEPLVEIDPEVLIPGRGAAADLLDRCVGQRVTRIQ